MSKKACGRTSPIRDVFDYDPETGIFRWKSVKHAVEGCVAGEITKYGTVRIRFGGKRCRAEQLAFLYMTGRMPKHVIHIDGNRGNNKWNNLLESTHKRKPRRINNMFKEKIDQDFLKKILDYDPGSGVFTFKVNQGDKVPGDVAGCVVKIKRNGVVVHSHIQIGLCKRHYLAHRLAFLWMTGKFPKLVDHKDGNPLNNRWENLREASVSQNQQNRKVSSNNKIGLKGVSPEGKAFVARLTINGRKIRIGRFRTAEEAHVAYQKAAKEHYGEFARFS